MNKTKLFTKVVILMILLTIVSHPALAASSKWNGTVGGVSVTAEKTLTLGSYLWNTYLYSRAASNINIIGMTYWTLEEYCPATGTYAYYKNYGGAYDTYDSYFSRSASVGRVGSLLIPPLLATNCN